MQKFIKNCETVYGYCLSDESFFSGEETCQETCMKKALSFCKKIKKDVNILSFEGNGYSLECNILARIFLL